MDKVLDLLPSSYRRSFLPRGPVDAGDDQTRLPREHRHLAAAVDEMSNEPVECRGNGHRFAQSAISEASCPSASFFDACSPIVCAAVSKASAIRAAEAGGHFLSPSPRQTLQRIYTCDNSNGVEKPNQLSAARRRRSLPWAA
jgi:hypothetical protein